MRTYPITDDAGRMTGFEIENAYVSLSTVRRILESVDGVSEVVKRKPFSAFDEIHIRFRFQEARCVVWEPFGDNSRYHIGPEAAQPMVDVGRLQQAFDAYQLPVYRRVFGDIVTLRFARVLFGRR